ncbi:MAG: MobF family relaxase [Bacteroidota bacterium]
MLRFHSIQDPKNYLTQHLDRGDYYAEGLEFSGLWQGRLAERLGLQGVIDKDSFAKLCDNLNPLTGEKLTQRNAKNRRAGCDISFHCPKSVSIMYALTQDERILEELRKAVAETMAEMEENMHTRVRKGRKKNHDQNRRTGNMVYGEFIHLTGRPVDGHPDPQLHVHCYAFNCTYDQVEDKIKAAQLSHIMKDQAYYQALFHNNFAFRLKEVGYSIERKGKSWEIEGIPRSLIEKFSRRTSEINKQRKDLEKQLGRKLTDKELNDLGARTRKSKRKDLTNEQLKDIWQGKLTSKETLAISKAKMGLSKGGGLSLTKEVCVDRALEHCFERKSVERESKVLAQALQNGIGEVSPQAIKNAFSTKEGIIREKVGNDIEMTTKQVQKEEAYLIKHAVEGKGQFNALCQESYSFKHDFLNDQQRAAVLHVLKSKDQLTMIRGGAGVGKTTCIKEAARGIKMGGRQVFAFAPTSQAAKVLRQDGFEEADTISRLMVDKEMQEQLHGQVIWIDEAGLVGSRAMNQVMRIAKEQRARVVMSGDTRQHASVERGDAMRILEQKSGIKAASINKVQRQKNYAYRQAVEDISEGKLEEGFNAIDDLGWVQEWSDRVRYKKIANSYIEALRARKSVLVVSPTHKERRKTTKEIRAAMKEANILNGEDQKVEQHVNLNLTVAERRDVKSYEEGQIIRFHQNVKGFKRGEIATIDCVKQGKVFVKSMGGLTVKEVPLEKAKHFQVYEQKSLDLAKGDKIRITQNGFAQDKKRLNNGAVYEVKDFTSKGDIELSNCWVLPKNYGNIDHGYVMTSHTSQGKTVDKVILSQSTLSQPAASREQFYVSVSRARQQVEIFTDDKEGLYQAVYQSK